MKRFLTKHENKIVGVLSGFDRLIFRGGIRGLLYEGGLAAYLNYKNILLKNFKVHAQSLTSELREKTEQYSIKHQFLVFLRRFLLFIASVFQFRSHQSTAFSHQLFLQGNQS